MKKLILIIFTALALNAEVSLEEISKIRIEGEKTIIPVFEKARSCWDKKLVHNRMNASEFERKVQFYKEWLHGLYSTTLLERSVNRKQYYEEMTFTPTYVENGKRYYCIYTIWKKKGQK